MGRGQKAADSTEVPKQVRAASNCLCRLALIGPRRVARAPDTERTGLAHGVLALPHAAGVLLALRRDGSWVGLSNEHLALDDALTQRADALLRFHGVPAADGQAQGPREPQRWLRQDGKAALLAGWRRASAHGELV